MPRIFLSYRRTDSRADARLLYERLSRRFGEEQVFFDIDTLKPGAKWRKVIEEKVRSCDALIAVIGPQWLTASDKQGRRRLEDPDDRLRFEIATALKLDILVIPATVGGASLPPAEELPSDLADLPGRNAVTMSDAGFNRDVDVLIRRLHRSGRPKGEVDWRDRKKRLRGRLVDLADEGVLPEPVLTKALEVIRHKPDQLPQQLRPYDELLQQLGEGSLELGEFIGSWYEVVAEVPRVAAGRKKTPSASSSAKSASPPISSRESVAEPRVEPSSELPAGTVKRNSKDGLDYVWIPPGDFEMGCSPGDEEYEDREKPPHQVTISTGFWLGQTQVTVAAYRQYAEKTGLKMPPEPKIGDRPLNPGWKDAQQPIVNVTWAEARAYCEWAGGRLPTEAEWEYAARAGTTSARYGLLNAIAWSADNSGNPLDSAYAYDVQAGKDWDKYAKILEENGNRIRRVGLKQANRWGLHDTLGNVWEWTQDWYREDYYKKSRRVDPPGPPRAERRVLRGGSWGNVPVVLRASDRFRHRPDVRSHSLGFRCAREVFP